MHAPTWIGNLHSAVHVVVMLNSNQKTGNRLKAGVSFENEQLVVKNF